MFTVTLYRRLQFLAQDMTSIAHRTAELEYELAAKLGYSKRSVHLVYDPTLATYQLSIGVSRYTLDLEHVAHIMNTGQLDMTREILTGLLPEDY